MHARVSRLPGANVLKGEPREFCLPDFEDLLMTLIKVPYVERCFFACLLPRTSLSVIFFLGGGSGLGRASNSPVFEGS